MFLHEGLNQFQSGIGELVSLAETDCHIWSSFDVTL